jgi:tetratricopeptide (TPR) repeat protein/DNA-binding XRE family transcriptional regulator
MGIEEQQAAEKAPRPASYRLKQERERHGWSQSELAERLGTTQVNISRWETGITTPGPFFRQRLADVFGKSLEDLGLVTEVAITDHKDTGTGDTHANIPAPAVQHIQRWNVPYHRNLFFTGREDILLHLYTILNTNYTAALTQTQAISGLGGIGKTQIAVEYAYRYREHYSAVLWVSAFSRDALIADFVMLAALLDLPEQYEQDQEIVISAVRRWLASNPNWLLILDNVDDLQIIVEFLPTQSTGKVLLTTRLQALGSVAQGIEVEKMGMDEGVLFLLRRTRMLASDTSLTRIKKEIQAQVTDIVTELGALPLALDQAGAYIEETRCGLPVYLMLYRTRRKELLHRRGRQPIDHPEPVAGTWSLSFQRVEQSNPAAADLLRFLSFCSPESIPEEILTGGGAELGQTLGPAATDPLQFNDVIELLLRYSLIRRNSEEALLSIHRLVQAVLKDWMGSDLSRDWAERAIRATNRAFPDVKLTTWDQCQRCLPHALLSMAHLEEYDLAFPEAADLLNKAAAYLTAHAQYAQAEPLLKKALAIREQTEQATHPDMAHTLNDLGALYLTQGRFPEAEPLLQEALKIRQDKLGPEHPDTATSLHNLAMLFFAEGNYSSAEEYYQAALKIRQSVLPSDHPDIALNLNSLAELFTTQARFDAAESLYKQALAIQERALGRFHPDVAKTLNNMAFLYKKKGEYSKAERLYADALDIQKLILVPDHPDVAQTLNNIARLHRAQGEYAKAEPEYQEALAIREKLFGPDHRYVGESRYSLAKVYRSLGKYDVAEVYGREALKIQEKQLGENHPDIASTLDVLAVIYQKQGKYNQAKELYLRAWNIRESASGLDHPHLAIIFNNLAEIYLAQGDYAEAKNLIGRSIKIREQKLGREHPYMAYSLSTFADCCFMLGDYQQAEALYREALENRQRNLGYDHPLTAASYRSLAKFYADLGRYEEAEPLYLQALAICEDITGLEYPDLAETQRGYVNLLRATGRDHQATELEKHVHIAQTNQSKSEGP